MTILQGDYTYDDLERLVDILEAQKGGGYISLQDGDVELLQRLLLSFTVAIPKPKMDEPAENYTVIRGTIDGRSLTFVRDGRALGSLRWVCLENIQRYSWSQINNPEVIDK